jgi:hypothetical protein
VALDGSDEIHPGRDIQLAEDMTQVGVHGVGRDEQPVGDPPVGMAGGGETHDLKLGVREGFPARFRAIQRLHPAPDAELTQPLAGSGRVARGSRLDADAQDAIEGVHRRATITTGQPGTSQVLQRGRRGQRTLASREDRRGLL